MLVPMPASCPKRREPVSGLLRAIRQLLFEQLRSREMLVEQQVRSERVLVKHLPLMPMWLSAQSTRK